MPGPAETYLDTLTTTLLLGAERAGSLPQTPPPGRLAARAAQPRAADKESALLDLAAAASPWWRAGRQPGQAGASPPEPAPPEEMPLCSPGAASLLARIVTGEYNETLGEWLDLAVQRGVRVPEDRIPDVLTFGQSRYELRPALAAAIGARGRWLAAQNPAWSYALADAAAANADDSWQTGTFDHRRLLLRALRAANPARALALVQSTWASDSPDDRARFLPELAIGLSMADEPFLESCLDDKRKPVRTAAADLLALLPESRLIRRMVDRARPLLTLDSGPKRKPLRKGAPRRISLALPTAFEPSMARDGLEQKDPQRATGDRAWWLQQIVSHIPPTFWSERWGMSPAEIVAAEIEDDNRDLLHIAWTFAAGVHSDADWMTALLLLRLDSLPQWPGFIGFTRMPGPGQELVAKAILDRGKDSPQALDWMAAVMRHVWSEEFSRLFLKSLTRAIDDAIERKRTKELREHLYHPLMRSSESMHPGCALELPPVFERVHEALPGSIKPHAIGQLEFRAQIHREFTP